MTKLYKLSVGGRVVELRVPITIVEDEKDTKVLCYTRDGRWYWRLRRNYMTIDEFIMRCSRVVTIDDCPSADIDALGIPYIFFARGEEGRMNKLLGVPSSELEKERSRVSHERYRDVHLYQMSRNNKRYVEEKKK